MSDDSHPPPNPEASEQSDKTGLEENRNKPTGLSAFWQELKRRHVVRVGMVYAVVAWLIIQIAATTFEGFGIPDWAFRFVVLMVLLGFPVTLIIAWAFELTPDGIKTTKVAREETVTTEAHSKKRNWFTFLFGAAVPTLIFGALAIYFYATRSGSDPSLLQVEDLEKSIAVLPLVNMSPDEENAFFADGVHEDIINNLSKIEELFVIGRTSTLQFRETTNTLSQIGDRLGVRYLVEGSVRRAGDQVRVTVQLIDSDTEGQLWSENFSRKLDDIFAIQAEVAKQIATKLQATLSPQTIKNLEYRPTENQKAYDYYKKLRQLGEQRLGNMDQKVALLEKAVSLDPQFAEAWAQLALERVEQWRVDRNRDDPQLLGQAYFALEQARHLGPNLPDIRHAGAFFAINVDGDVEAATRLELEALSIDPSFHYAKRFLANRSLISGQLDEALKYRREVHAVDPLSLRANTDLLRIYQILEMWDDAVDLIHENLENTNNDPYWAWSQDETEYLRYGNRQAFLEAMRESAYIKGNPVGEAWIAILERNVAKALSTMPEGRNITFLPRYGFLEFLFRDSFLNALIWFELDNRDNWIRASENTRRYIAAGPYGEPQRWAQLAVCYALEGDRVEMEAAIKKLRELSSLWRWRYVFEARGETIIAIAHLVLGEETKAIEVLEAAHGIEGPDILSRSLDHWFIFDRLRGNPRFDALLRGELLGPSDVVEESVHEKSIAVLPLENMSPDPDNAFFADGVQEDILTNLSKIKDLLVISRSSTLQYRNPDRNLKQIGKELGVRYLVEGSVRRANNRVLVTTQLIDTETDGHVWADSFNRDLADIFAIQAEVAKEIAGQLQAVITPDALERLAYRPTENQAAYDAFVRARQLLLSSSMAMDRIPFLKQAVVLDPEFGEAWAYLSHAKLSYWDGQTNREDSGLLAEAEIALEQAQVFGPELAATRFAESVMSTIRDHDRDKSVGLLLEALKIDSSFYIAQQEIGNILMHAGRLAEVQHHLEAALRVDPLAIQIRKMLISAYCAQKMWEKAKQLCLDSIAKFPGNFEFIRLLGQSEYLETGNVTKLLDPYEKIEQYAGLRHALQARDFQKVMDIFQSTNRFGQRFTFLSYSGWAFELRPGKLFEALLWFELGEKERSVAAAAEARQELESIVENDPDARSTIWSCQIICHALEGNREGMERLIELALKYTSAEYYRYRHQAVCEIHIAMAYAILGDHDLAIERLEAASQLDTPMHIHRELPLMFFFDRLRGNPRFDALLKD
jgi:TolB-like protein/predicted Zn-dependent protease